MLRGLRNIRVQQNSTISKHTQDVALALGAAHHHLKINRYYLFTLWVNKRELPVSVT